ncbi:hypothetical protein MIDIC_110003 [Alphaproteobacteria bacterium]
MGWRTCGATRSFVWVSDLFLMTTAKEGLAVTGGCCQYDSVRMLSFAGDMMVGAEESSLNPATQRCEHLKGELKRVCRCCCVLLSAHKKVALGLLYFRAVLPFHICYHPMFVAIVSFIGHARRAFKCVCYIH